MTKYQPIFYKDGTITYWVDTYGWFHRIHPKAVMGKVAAKWKKAHRDKLKALLESKEVK